MLSIFYWYLCIYEVHVIIFFSHTEYREKKGISKGIVLDEKVHGWSEQVITDGGVTHSLRAKLLHEKNTIKCKIFEVAYRKNTK